jgi:ParB/RepB/Spo0J family partition protein
MENNIRSIPISKLLPHPANPNVMSDSTFGKLVRNIERTGLYEPIVVRPHPEKKNCFEIINGHHRVKALEKLGRLEANCVVWDVDDEQTEILLATLNRLCGSDSPARKIELLKELSKRIASKDLSKLLPQTRKQIERLINLKLSINTPKLSPDSFAIPLVFFVSKQQQEIIEKAINHVGFMASDESGVVYGGGLPGVPLGGCEPDVVHSVKMTRAQRRAYAITEIANQFMRENICQPQKI